MQAEEDAGGHAGGDGGGVPAAEARVRGRARHVPVPLAAGRRHATAYVYILFFSRSSLSHVIRHTWRMSVRRRKV